MGNLNFPSQEQQNVQLLKCLLKENTVTAQLFQIVKIEIEWLLRDTIIEGKGPFLSSEKEKRRSSQ